MPGQAGRVSDAIDNEDDLSAAMRRSVKIRPTGTVYRGHGGTSGNGDPCIRPGHGKMQVLSSGRQWCSNQSHDMGEPRDSDEPWEDPRHRKEPQDG